jgi:hypothetical protein
MSRIRKHLTYANVISTLTLFLVLGGGAALAAYVVSSNSQIGPGTVSGHKPPTGKHANIIANSINGQDIADRSGVDTCKTPLTKKLGPICAGSDGIDRKWVDAIAYCNSFGLRLPTISEATALATNYDVPGVGSNESFWTDNYYVANTGVANIAFENGDQGDLAAANTDNAVCVTDPSA